MRFALPGDPRIYRLALMQTQVFQNQKYLIARVFDQRAQKFDQTISIESVRKNAPNDAGFDRKATSRGQPMFNQRAGNHQVNGTSESCSSSSAMGNGIASVKANASNAEVDDQAS